MRYLIFLPVFAMLNFLGCRKLTNDGLVTTDISITQTQTPKNVVHGADIVSKVTCMAPNPCYSFKNFEVTETQPKTYNIRAMATYDPNAICIMVIHRIDTTLTIKSPAKGTYFFNFYNDISLFKTDTVIVN